MPILLLSIVSLLLRLSNCQDWDRHLILDPEDKYHVLWTITDEDVTFQIEVQTRGWVGFGISADGGMVGSDVVIGWIANNRAGFHDRYAVSKSLPVIDDHQDWEFIWCCENDTHTMIRFRRKLLTCDEQDLSITDETTRLIYAYNDEDPTSATSMKYHGVNRGFKSVLLFQPRRRRSIPSDSRFWDVTSANVLIPHDKDTTHYCTMFVPPTLDRKYHVVRVEPIIQKGNERFVHHMILYKCSKVPESTIYPFRLKQYTECYKNDQSSKFPFCQHVWAGWAVGGEAFEFPDHAGVPIEEGYYRLEVHYDNPQLMKGIYDNSGLRLTYTPNLRQYDSDYLTIGNLWRPCVFVPPRQTNFVTSGHAHPDCLRKGIPPDGIKVFAVALHSHLIGKSITVRHFRQEEELPPIASERNYDFNYQEFRLLPKERIVLPEDHLVVECTYDSSERNQTTFGGLGSRQEMCLAVLTYYPKLAIESSFSCPLPKRVLKAIGVNEMSSNSKFVVSPITGQNETYIDFLNNYPWDSESLNNIQYAVRYGSHVNICTVGGNVTVTSTRTTYPRVKRSYEEPDLCASGPSPSRSTVLPRIQEVPSTRRPPQSTPRVQEEPSTRRPPRQTAGPLPPVTERRPTSVTERPQRRKKVPQTIPYELIDAIIRQLG